MHLFPAKVGAKYALGNVGGRRQSDNFANTSNIQTQVLSAYLWELSLIVASLGHHTQFTFQNHPCLGPQMTTSGKIRTGPHTAPQNAKISASANDLDITSSILH
jgi:hypothetical protein